MPETLSSTSKFRHISSAQFFKLCCLEYSTDDLVKYASELRPAKSMLIIVNKSDLLTDYQRLEWARQFEHMGIKALFYSAHFEQEK
jgi:ribosome biogenesis GTPase A